MTISTYDIGAGGIGNIAVDSDQPNRGPDVGSGTGFWLKARSGNTGNIHFSYVSASSDADSTGWELAAGESVPVQVFNLNELYFTADTVGNQIAWMKF